MGRVGDSEEERERDGETKRGWTGRRREEVGRE